MIDETHTGWEISQVREAISCDWANLAVKELTSDQRRAIREHLEMNIAALRDLVTRNRLASRTARLQSVQDHFASFRVLESNQPNAQANTKKTLEELQIVKRDGSSVPVKASIGTLGRVPVLAS